VDSYFRNFSLLWCSRTEKTDPRQMYIWVFFKKSFFFRRVRTNSEYSQLFFFPPGKKKKRTTVGSIFPFWDEKTDEFLFDFSLCLSIGRFAFELLVFFVEKECKRFILFFSMHEQILAGPNFFFFVHDGIFFLRFYFLAKEKDELKKINFFFSSIIRKKDQKKMRSNKRKTTDFYFCGRRIEK
jgi:hypothetical protein